MDAFSDRDRTDLSQAKHFQGIGTLDEAIDPDMKVYVARCTQDEAEVHRARDGPRQLKSGKLGADPENQGAGPSPAQSYLEQRRQQDCRTSSGPEPASSALPTLDSGTNTPRTNKNSSSVGFPLSMLLSPRRNSWFGGRQRRQSAKKKKLQSSGPPNESRLADSYASS